MDSRDAMHHHPPPHHLHHLHHHHHGMVVGSAPTPPPPPAYLSSHAPAIGGAPGPSSGGLMQQPRFPFNSLSSSSSPADQHPHHPGLDPGVFEGSGVGGGGGSGFSIDSAKKKRGRPRKYTPEGNIALGLGPTGSGGGGGGSGGGHFDGMSTPGSGDVPVKKHRGRPPGVEKRQMDALGAGGIGFTPHVIFVKAGEDIASKIMSFTQEGPRTVCILSANGAVSNVTLRQPSMAVGTVSYEGRFEIISVSGSFIFSEEDGSRNRNDSLSVSLAGSDGRVIGGIVAGLLIAAGPVQVIVGSFIANGRKPKSSSVKSEPASLAVQNQGSHSQMLNFSAAAAAAAVSPSSQGGSGESSDENGNSPVNRHPPGLFSDPRQPGSHGIQMYHHLWAGQASQ